jgi:hypothetical protein
MNYVTLKIPARLELEPSLAFAQQLSTQPDNVTILALDFSAWKTVRGYELPIRPFGLLVISQAVRQFRQRVPGAVIVPTELPGNDIEGYAAHMGFFDALGCDVEKPFGDARGSQTYLPLTQRTTSNMHHGSDAEALAYELAQKLTQQTHGGLVKTLAYSFTEIIRNVIEHSQSEDFWYCAQYWPSRGEAEIALIDCGIGLRTSLSMNPNLQPLLVDDKAAIKYALWPGASGKRHAGMPSNPNDPWQNSGYGLYMNYRICNEGGNFFIASGDTGLFREKEADNHYQDYALSGVALRLCFRVATLEAYDEVHHKRFLQDANREAEKIQGGILPTGDRMSQMLRDSFDVIGHVTIVGAKVCHPSMGTAVVEDVRTSNKGNVMLTIKLTDGRKKTVRVDEVSLEDDE